MLLDSDAFRERLTGFERSAWRWECQPVYGIPSEQPSVAAYAAGEPRPAGLNAGWHERVREIVRSGRTIGRVRVIRHPLTEYQRRQLDWVYPDSAKAGEDIRILDLTEDDLGLPNQDFWLLDEQTVIHLNFADDGKLLARKLIEQADVAQYLHWRETAIKHSVPIADYVRT